MPHITKDILYTFRRCPYAMRARWALLMAGKVVVAREVSLKNKPKELFIASPKGTVPVLLKSNGEIINESLDIMKWAIKTSPICNELETSLIEISSEAEDIITENDGPFKYHLDRFKYAQRFPNEDADLHYIAARNIIIGWNNRIKINKNKSSLWLIGESETLADWAIWPFVRQFRMANKNLFDKDTDVVSIKSWLEKYTNHIKFKSLMAKAKPWSPGEAPTRFPML